MSLNHYKKVSYRKHIAHQHTCSGVTYWQEALGQIT